MNSNTNRSPNASSTFSNGKHYQFGPGGCQAIIQGKKCGETRTLEIIGEFKRLYEKKMKQIDAEAGGDCIQAKINLQQDWIRDLSEQNDMLVKAVEELECEAAQRVTMLEEKLKNTSKCACEHQTRLKDKDNKIKELEAKLKKVVGDGAVEDVIEAKKVYNQYSELKKSMMDMRDALTAEVAHKHDVILTLRRDIQFLEEQCKKADQQTHFKDDIIKELRKEIKQLKQQKSPKTKPRSPHTVKKDRPTPPVHNSQIDPSTTVTCLKEGTIIIKDVDTVGDAIATQKIKEKYADPTNQTIIYICENTSPMRKNKVPENISKKTTNLSHNSFQQNTAVQNISSISQTPINQEVSRDYFGPNEVSRTFDSSINFNGHSSSVNYENSRSFNNSQRHMEYPRGGCHNDTDEPKNSLCYILKEIPENIDNCDFILYPSVQQTCVEYSKGILNILDQKQQSVFNNYEENVDNNNHLLINTDSAHKSTLNEKVKYFPKTFRNLDDYQNNVENSGKVPFENFCQTEGHCQSFFTNCDKSYTLSPVELPNQKNELYSINLKDKDYGQHSNKKSGLNMLKRVENCTCICHEKQNIENDTENFRVKTVNLESVTENLCRTMNDIEINTKVKNRHAHENTAYKKHRNVNKAELVVNSLTALEKAIETSARNQIVEVNEEDAAACKHLLLENISKVCENSQITENIDYKSNVPTDSYHHYNETHFCVTHNGNLCCNNFESMNNKTKPFKHHCHENFNEIKVVGQHPKPETENESQMINNNVSDDNYRDFATDLLNELDIMYENQNYMCNISDENDDTSYSVREVAAFSSPYHPSSNTITNQDDKNICKNYFRMNKNISQASNNKISQNNGNSSTYLNQSPKTLHNKTSIRSKVNHKCSRSREESKRLWKQRKSSSPRTLHRVVVEKPTFTDVELSYRSKSFPSCAEHSSNRKPKMQLQNPIQLRKCKNEHLIDCNHVDTQCLNKEEQLKNNSFSNGKKYVNIFELSDGDRRIFLKANECFNDSQFCDKWSELHNTF